MNEWRCLKCDGSRTEFGYCSDCLKQTGSYKMKETRYGANYNACCSTYGKHTENCKRIKKFVDTKNADEVFDRRPCDILPCHKCGELVTGRVCKCSQVKMNIFYETEGAGAMNDFNNNFSNCTRCKKPIGTMEVHDLDACNLYVRANQRRDLLEEERKKATYAATFLNEREKSPTPSDEDLARKLFTALDLNRGLMELVQSANSDFESLSIKNVKVLANIMKEMMKLKWIKNILISSLLGIRRIAKSLIL